MKFIILFISYYLFCASLNASEDHLKYSDFIPSLDLPTECKAVLENHYASGSDLFFYEVSNHAISFEELSKQINYPLNDLYYYHYTNHDYSKRTTYLNDEDIFPFFKKRYLNNIGSMDFVAGVYISYDSLSSRKYGDYLIRFKLSSQASIITHQNLDSIEWEKLLSKHPLISKFCSKESLKPIIIEDSGIDLVWYRKGFSDKKRWFQLLNFNSIDEAKFSKSPWKLRKYFFF